MFGADEGKGERSGDEFKEVTKGKILQGLFGQREGLWLSLINTLEDVRILNKEER